MEVRDGFIIGIFNYCDSWCERCPFTSRCHVFAHRAEMEARLDPQYAAIVNAPARPEEVVPPPPRWMQELIEEMNDACRNPPSAEELARFQPRVPVEHAPVNARAKEYAFRTFRWLQVRETSSPGGRDDAYEVVSWFHFMIGAKINRALTVWPDDDDELVSSDADGSAKVALIGIERSHAAWLSLVERDLVSAGDAEPFITDLVWLGQELERIRPHARAFVRPGFDEPDDVARLLASC